MNYKSDDKLVNMLTKNFIWSSIGVFSGLLINNTTIQTYKILKIKNKMLQNMIQIFYCSLFLAYIQIYINNYFGWSWQNITPGLFFVSFFFGTQYKIFANLNDFSITDVTDE